MNRQTFFDGLTVEEGTMSLIQDNIESADKNLAKDFVGSGIIEGGIVTKLTSQTLHVTDTIGYDQDGNRIELSEADIDVSSYIPTDAGQRYISLVLKFSRKDSSPATDDYGQTRYYVNEESAKTSIVAGAVVTSSPTVPVLTSDDLLCSDILVGINGIESISTSRVKRLSPSDKKLIDVYASIETAEAAAKAYTKEYAEAADAALKEDILGGAAEAIATETAARKAYENANTENIQALQSADTAESAARKAYENANSANVSALFSKIAAESAARTAADIGYSGGEYNESDLPVGSIVLVRAGKNEFFVLNSKHSGILYGLEKEYVTSTVGTEGTLLAGTWACRGCSWGDTDSNDVLFQRLG